MLLSALLHPFPERSGKATARHLLKAAVIQGTFDSSRATSKGPLSRRQMSQVTEALHQESLQPKVTGTLRSQTLRWVPRTSVNLAIDTHLVTYAGKPEKSSQFLASKAKQGTTRSHGYFAVAIVLGDRRLTLGPPALPNGGHHVDIVRRHLTDAPQLGVKVGWLFMDREFYNAEVIRYLQFRHLRAAIPGRAGWKMAAEGETLVHHVPHDHVR